MLDNAVDSFEVLPDETTDTWVTGDSLERAVGAFVARGRALDWYIVSERLGPVRDLGAKNMCNIALEYCGRICPAHRKDRETEGS